MKKFIWKDLSESEKISVLQRPVKNDEAVIYERVKNVLNEVKQKGDASLLEFTQKFDGVSLQALKVTDKEFSTARDCVSKELKKAIKIAYNNIKKFHGMQIPKDFKTSTMVGIKCGKYWVPIQKTGFYIPGGKAPLVSTVLMLGVPSLVAKNKLRIICTPPQKDGTVNPAILFAAQLCGIKDVYKVGGAQAIAAMAYGTESIPKMDKIFGPGNAYVTTAKMLCGVAIDMPAGPSEILIIADETANTSFITTDLLSQLEHGDDSQVILVSNSLKIIDEVMREMEEKGKSYKSLNNAVFIKSQSIAESIAISNIYAPEHLSLQIKNSEGILKKIENAGSVFVGKWSPVAVGDYASGTNHVLPTYGYASSYSGLGTLSFMKSITFQELSNQGIKNIGKTVLELSGTEGLLAHKESVSVRLEKKVGK